MLSIGKGSDVRYLTKEVGVGAEHYYLKAIEQAGEPAGIWLGKLAEEMGLVGEIDHDVMHAVFHEYLDPRRLPEVARQLGEAGIQWDSPEAEKYKDAIRLGDKPRDYSASNAKRLEKALAAEPDATPERRKQIEIGVRSKDTKATHYYDLTFSAPKSWSVYHAALQVAGHHEEAALVWEAWMTGVRTGLDYMQDQAGYSRAGHHGKTVEGRSSGRYVDAHEWIIGAFRQHTSRENDPQLHVHCPVLNKVKTIDTDPVTGEKVEVWRALHGQELWKHRKAAGIIAERAAEEALTRLTGARVEMRPDGKAREIVGITPEMRDRFSTRRQAISEGVAQVAKAYEERYGHAPSAYELTKMSQLVTLDLRAAKGEAPTRDVLLRQWEREAVADLRTSLADVPSFVTWESLQLQQQDQEMPFDPAKVVREAIESVQSQHASWTRPDLIVELNQRLPDCLGGLEGHQVTALLGELADAALQPGATTGVVQLTAPFAVPIPSELTREDGGFLYEPRTSGFIRYATEDHLQAEERLRTMAEQIGAPQVNRLLVEAALSSGQLNELQAQALRGITTSGLRLEILVGPAGTGKSRLVGTLTDVWEKANGEGSVLGVASSQRATNVLAEEGVTQTANIQMLLTANKQFAEGRSVPNAELYRLRAGQLLIVDEAGMSDTTQLDELRRLADQAGAKILLSGDFAQLTSVDAGGLFAQLAHDLPNVHVLEEVVRFSQEWERKASLQLRAGDTQVLSTYEAHGRLRGGTAEEMSNRAYQGWLADYMGGTESLLITATNAQAHDLSMRARADLVRGGWVEAEGIDLVRGDQVIRVGKGDQIQLRRNDRKLVGDQGHWATNRDVARVIARGDDNSLLVQYPDGEKLLLPASYVREHVELAYAGTVYAAQGRTVDTCHALVDTSSSRENLYVALSRGRAGNFAYVVVPVEDHVTPGGLVLHEERGDLMAVLDEVMGRQELEQSATAVIRAELERSGRLDVLEPVWADLLDEHAAERFGQVLVDTLGVEAYRQLRTEEAYGMLLRLAQYGEAEGHDMETMLAEVATWERGLDSADSMSATLHWRLNHAIVDAEKAIERAEAAEAHEAREQQAADVADAIAQQQAIEPTEPEGPFFAPEVEAAAIEQFMTLQQAPELSLDWNNLPDAEQAQRAVVDMQTDVDMVGIADNVAEEAAQQAAIDQFMAVNTTMEVLHSLQDVEVHQRHADEREAAAEARSTYAGVTPEIDGPKGELLRALAEAQDQRTAELGRRAAEEPPAWALDRLGPVPEDPIAREQWQEKAGQIERYREAHGYSHETDAIGAAPPKGTNWARQAWESARRALGLGTEQADVARASDAELREAVERYQREEQWAPDYVADQLRDTLLARDDHRVKALQLQLTAEEEGRRVAEEHTERVTDAVTAVQTGPQMPTEERDAIERLMAVNSGAEVLHIGVEASAVQAEMQDRATERQELARMAAERARQLQEIHEAREQWYEHTAQAREDSALAREELERREVRGPAPELDQDQALDAAADTATRPAEPAASLEEQLQKAREATQLLHERAEQAKAREAEQQLAHDDTGLTPEEAEHQQRASWPAIEENGPQQAQPGQQVEQAPAQAPQQAVRPEPPAQQQIHPSGPEIGGPSIGM